MVPHWVLIAATLGTFGLGISLGLILTGRRGLGKHGFYDDALSVSATIERVTAQDERSADEIDASGADEGDYPPDTTSATEQLPQYDALGPRHEYADSAELPSAVVRYYFAQYGPPVESAARSTVSPPGGVSSTSEVRHTSGHPHTRPQNQPRHALNEELAG